MQNCQRALFPTGTDRYHNNNDHILECPKIVKICETIFGFFQPRCAGGQDLVHCWADRMGLYRQGRRGHRGSNQIGLGKHGPCSRCGWSYSQKWY